MLKLSAIVCILGMCAVSVLSCDTQRLKVMSLNLRTSLANDPCPSGCWPLRKGRIEQLLARYTPHFIGTQEGAPEQIEFFENDLKYSSFGECAGPCAFNERNSIFYRDEEWNVIEGNTFALSDTPDIVPSNTWNLQYLRAAVWARFKHRETGKVVCIFNTHYDMGIGHELSSRLVAQRMAEHCSLQDTIILMGDLNTQPFTPAIQYLTGEGKLYGRQTPIPLFETLMAAGAGYPTWIGGSFSASLTDAKLDYIFARRDRHSCLMNGTVILDTFDGFTVSDHAAIQSEFCIGADCGPVCY